jgi:GT2 family glycosyltransferase
VNKQVCAVVVTYNRKALLLECLNALLAQTYSVARILLIDNASTDGTADLLREKEYLDNSLIEYLHMPTNTGGAGGFHEGIKWAYKKGFEWIWVMDDDTIPEPNALSELFVAYGRFDKGQQPSLLASKVIWLDGSLHTMNMLEAKTRDFAKLALAAQNSTLSVRYSTFVSTLLHRTIVEKYGLPISDYFIWGDDIEYTARILRNEFGVFVPASLVLHKTVNQHTWRDKPEKAYYHVRNNLWMLTRSSAWSRNEKVKMAVGFLLDVSSWLSHYHFKWSFLRTVFLGLKDGLFKVPNK